MIAIDPPPLLHPADSRARLGAAESDACAIAFVPAVTRGWTALAVASLVIAGLLSLAVVIGRLPVVSRWIADPLFFKRCLVVHVDLALLAWFYTFMAGMAGLRVPFRTSPAGRVALAASGAGMALMLAGGIVPGAMPVLSNYIPIIDHPLFLGGLALFFGGVLFFFVPNLLAPPMPRAGGLPADAAVGLQAAGVALVLAAAAWVSARTGLPDGIDAWTRAEFSGWGAGHVLQVANVSAMLAVWLWLLSRATGRQVLSVAQARVLFAVLLAPHFIMPLLTWRGTLNSLYIDGATMLMRWGIFPVVMMMMFLSARHLRRYRAEVDEPLKRMAATGFSASVVLMSLGMVLGAMIRGSTTLIPAHYHASLGAVTAAFMAGVFLIIEAVARDSGRVDALAGQWRAARRQIILFGSGQSVFAIGFGIGGIYGLGRKAYAAEQHVRSVGEVMGLIIMGIGGLVAFVAGVWFLTLVIREMRRWGCNAEAAPAHITSTTKHP